MAIESGDIITYSDLTDFVVERITTRCKNVDGYSADVANELRPGYAYTIANNAARVTITVQNSAYLNTVTSATVRSQLESFMASRGIASKAKTPVTLKGMINFYNNVAVFIGQRFVVVGSNATNSTSLFYYSGNAPVSQGNRSLCENFSHSRGQKCPSDACKLFYAAAQGTAAAALTAARRTASGRFFCFLRLIFAPCGCGAPARPSPPRRLQAPPHRPR